MTPRGGATQALLDRIAALGDATRLRVLRVLEAEELSVGEVSRVVQLPQSTVSRHLKVLLEGGWVVRRSEGPAALYRLVADDLSPEARQLWLAVHGQLDAEELREDRERLGAVLAERRTDSQAFFGRFAGEWDDLRTELFGGRFTGLALLALIRPEWVVGDLGCGTGNVSELLAPAVERVDAVDFSGPMLAAARQRLAGLANVRFVEGSVESTGLAGGSLDAAVSVLVLHHIESPVAALREMRRVLRADRHGGVAVVVDMVRHGREEYRRTMGHKHPGFSREEMGGMFASAGFARSVYRELPREPEAKGPGLFVAAAWLG